MTTQQQPPPGPPRQRNGSKPNTLQPYERLMRLAVRLPGEAEWRWWFWLQVDGTSVITALHHTRPTSWQVDAHWEEAYGRFWACVADEAALEEHLARQFGTKAEGRWCFGETLPALEQELAAVNMDRVPDLSTLGPLGGRH